MTSRTVTLKVRCSVCRRLMVGHPTPDGRIAVAKHPRRSKERCPGTDRGDHQLARQRQKEAA